MALIYYRPTSSGRRGASVIDYKRELTRGHPEKSLVEKLASHGGRNSNGRITSRHKVHSHRRRYRLVDFKRNKDGVPAKVREIEYDPNRSAFIALLQYVDGEKRYILCPNGMKVGQTVVSGDKVEPDLGNAMPLRAMPLGTVIHCVELQPGQGGKMLRAAGAQGRLMAKESGYAHVELASGEMRMVTLECRATIGQVGNLDHQNVVWGQAGRAIHALHRRPVTRGMAKNPVDHPMGGGAARRKGHIPQSPSGVLAKGGKTRKPKALSNKLILRRRKGAPTEIK
jgi:large subunit ribosomal protein L2